MKKTIATCTCGHNYDAHTHYRPGHDCGFSTCTCTGFTPRQLTERPPLPTEVGIEEAAAVAETPGVHLRVIE